MLNSVIICVDDEAIVLEGLKSQLKREFGKNNIVEVAQSGDEALEIIKDYLKKGFDIPVLITDQIMPEMKGSELLNIVKNLTPHTRNILLTGQAGADDVGEAVNSGNLYRYISKPWERTDLTLTVQEAIKSYRSQNEILQKNRQLQEYAEKLEQKVEERTREVQKEKEESERLLLNILPEETAAELKKEGNSPPRHYDKVSVLFTDFVGFTTHAMGVSPSSLVESLGQCFNAFDEIIEKYDLEKIKTIGDSYMCVGGIPVPNARNPIDAVKAAIEMQEWLKNWNLERMTQGLSPWEMRLGIHTGDCVAGVIGIKKFAYDLWGDTVNIASRMEYNSEPGKINISQSTYEFVKDNVRCLYRGEIEVKGNRSVKMYFID